MRAQSFVATLCALLVLSPPGIAQQQTPPTAPTPGERNIPATPAGSFNFHRPGDWVTRPYRQPDIPPINLQNSNRAEQLVRDGKVYLSLQDAIALAL